MVNVIIAKKISKYKGSHFKVNLDSTSLSYNLTQEGD